MVRAEGKDGASRLLLGSLLGVSAETVRTVGGARWPSSSSPRAGAVLPHVDDETRARMEQSDEGGLFAAAIAEGRRRRTGARGGRVFGAVGGAVPASALPAPGGERKKESAARGERRAAAAATPAAPREEVPRPASAKAASRENAAATYETNKTRVTEKEKEKEVLTIRSA